MTACTPLGQMHVPSHYCPCEPLTSPASPVSDQSASGQAITYQTLCFASGPGDLLARLSEIKGEVKCLGFRPNGSHLALGFDSGELHVYEWPSLKIKLSLRSGRGDRRSDLQTKGRPAGGC